MANAETRKLKSAILQGVYEENLKIAERAPSPSRRRFRRYCRRARIPVFLLLLAAVALVLPRFPPFPEQRPGAEPAAVAAQDPLLPWSSILANYTTPLALPPAERMIRGPAPLPAVPFDAGRLLDYDLLLNSRSVRLSSVFGLGIKTIVIDPGHGGKDPGAIGSRGTREKDIVLAIGLRLRDLLLQNGRYRVLMTRDDDSFLSLADRVRFANRQQADLFISLHINALPQKESNVTETFYFGPPSDLYTLRLAEQENRGSEIKTGDFRNMIKKIGDMLKEQESATLATTIQHSLFSNMKKYDKNISDAGIKIAPFVVLLGVDAPSVLVEISCITKEEEELSLSTPGYRDRIALFLEEGITRYLSQRHFQVVKGEKNDKKIGNKSG
ncbi:MAG TPA: N-acetylmuramoyl-L-alanine amidase [Desulfobulbus sp.]|nr:N-acetylmuramoyl-L-alanine amidase [Desulfobulbus sp.]